MILCKSIYTCEGSSIHKHEGAGLICTATSHQEASSDDIHLSMYIYADQLSLNIICRM